MNVFKHIFDIVGGIILCHYSYPLSNCITASGTKNMYHYIKKKEDVGTNKKLGRARDPRANSAWLSKLTE